MGPTLQPVASLRLRMSTRGVPPMAPRTPSFVPSNLARILHDPEPEKQVVRDLRRYHTKYAEPTASPSAVQYSIDDRMS